ncbi:hypothetical protein BDR04DRAFT_74798 [Suillus decipiens]|nr:hypothetical protein BDR04DRAFT_74798 [Suillus decipiens]
MRCFSLLSCPIIRRLIDVSCGHGLLSLHFNDLTLHASDIPQVICIQQGLTIYRSRLRNRPKGVNNLCLIILGMIMDIARRSCTSHLVLSTHWLGCRRSSLQPFNLVYQIRPGSKLNCLQLIIKLCCVDQNQIIYKRVRARLLEGYRRPLSDCNHRQVQTKSVH